MCQIMALVLPDWPVEEHADDDVRNSFDHLPLELPFVRVLAPHLTRKACSRSLRFS